MKQKFRRNIFGKIVSDIESEGKTGISDRNAAILP